MGTTKGKLIQLSSLHMHVTHEFSCNLKKDVPKLWAPKLFVCESQKDRKAVALQGSCRFASQPQSLRVMLLVLLTMAVLSSNSVFVSRLPATTTELGLLAISFF